MIIIACLFVIHDGFEGHKVRPFCLSLRGDNRSDFSVFIEFKTTLIGIIFALLSWMLRK